MPEIFGSPYAGAERVELYPEEGFLNIEFGSKSEVLLDRLGDPTGVYLIKTKQVHVYGNKSMFFFERDRLYKYVLSNWILNPAIAEYRDEDWPFEDVTFFFPEFDITLGVLYNEAQIQEKLGIEYSLKQVRGNRIELERGNIVIEFLFGTIQGRDYYSLSQVLVRVQDQPDHGDDVDDG